MVIKYYYCFQHLSKPILSIENVNGVVCLIINSAKPYNRMKLMFVGKSDIGKTTLLNELRKEAAVFGRHHSEVGDLSEDIYFHMFLSIPVLRLYLHMYSCMSFIQTWH